MTDIITYVKDSMVFLKEVESKFPDKVIYSENPDPTNTAFVPTPVSVKITKTPTIRKGGVGVASLAIARCDTQELADTKALSSVKILAEVPMGGDLLAAMTTANRKLYDGVHDQTPVAVLDDKGKPMLDANGKAVMHTPPALIGAFA